MKSKLYLLFFLCAPLFFVACGDDDATDTIAGAWQIENEAQFARIAMNPDFTRRESLSGNGFIMYRVLASGDPSGRSPYFNEQVWINYTGWFKNDWSMPATFVNDRGHTIINRIVFDTTIDDRGNARPRPFRPNQLIPGFADALQHMRPGDRWEVWIPWSLGYGRNDHHGIRGFSTLVFEIEMVRF